MVRLGFGSQISVGWVVQMENESSFSDLMRRVRQGDEVAATELVRLYEPLIRREVGLQLEKSRLIRSLDAVDVSQSVLASFFVRAAGGAYDLDRPEQLIRLLMKMARNKLASKARWQFSVKRESRRVDLGPDAMDQIPDPMESPSEDLSGQELLEQFNAKLSEEELRICRMRRCELSWLEIAEQLGGTPFARRMQLTRAIDRVSKELGLDR
jgi:RNA polymerase sigma factor (sigma-70 family)